MMHVNIKAVESYLNVFGTLYVQISFLSSTGSCLLCHVLHMLHILNKNEIEASLLMT